MMSRLQECVPRLPYSVVECALRNTEIDAIGKMTDCILRDQLTSHLMNTQAMGLA